MRRVDVDNACIELRGIDLLHGTPVVDIKPYIAAYDRVADEDAVRFPAWVDESTQRPPAFTVVEFLPDVELTMDCICTNTRPPAGLFAAGKTLGYAGLYQNDTEALRQCLVQTLQWDIRSNSQRSRGLANFSVLLDGIRFQYRIEGHALLVNSCTLEDRQRRPSQPYRVPDEAMDDQAISPAPEKPCP